MTALKLNRVAKHNYDPATEMLTMTLHSSQRISLHKTTIEYLASLLKDPDFLAGTKTIDFSQAKQGCANC